MEEEKLSEMYEFTKENNRMLHAMRRNARIGSIAKLLFWIFILVVLPYSAWLYVQPYVQEIQGTYNSVQQGKQSFENSSIVKFFEQFGTTTKK